MPAAHNSKTTHGIEMKFGWLVENRKLFNWCDLITVEPRLTTTSLIRPPRYYDHFFLARQNVHTFSYKNTPLMRAPRLCDQRPPF